MGLADYDARIHIELMRDPQTIEEAVEEALIYMETVKDYKEENNRENGVRQVRTFPDRNGNQTRSPDKSLTKEDIQQI